MTNHECPPLQTSQVYEGETGDASILIGEVFAPEGAVAIAVVDDENAALMVADPERALEIAAGIAEAAHRAMWRRELAGEAW